MKNISSQQIVLIIVSVTMFLISHFYMSATPSSVNGHIPSYNMDTLMYYQHARNWAEGHPYIHNEGDSPSTGCTSHLYPIILSILYRLGCTSHKLISASFVLNSLFLVTYLILMWGVIKRVLTSPFFQLLAFALLATNGHLIFHFLGQSDMGLFTMCSGAFFLCLLSRRYFCLSILTLFLPFVRPEGIVLNLACCVAASTRLFL